jgi:hypothetical protein
MVKNQKKIITETFNGKAFNTIDVKARNIKASMPYEICYDQLSPFCGLLGLTKFLDLVKMADF